MNKNSLIITILVAIIVGGAAFFGGEKYQQSQARSGFAQFAGQGGFGRFGGGRNGAGTTVGKIISTDTNSVTVQLPDGSSKIVNYSGSTRIVKSSTATSSDLTTGTEVAVFGTTNSDGSVTAQNIQINPVQMFRPRPSGTPTQ